MQEDPFPVGGATSSPRVSILSSGASVSKKAPTRCTGHCCRSFSLHRSPEELQSMSELPKGHPRRMTDIDQLVEMLIYLGSFPTNPLLCLKGEDWQSKAVLLGGFTLKPKTKDVTKEPGKAHFYTCRHIQLNGDCGIYATRPEMCRTYPNERLCEFGDCTWDPKDQKKHLRMAQT
jgi:Fe-S-cluster containining protein